MAPISRHLFVDTNVFLSFYDFTDDDLDSLSKLKESLKERHIKLFLTGQVKDEFYRNRENKIKSCLDIFVKDRFAERLPRIAEGIDGYERVKALMRDISDQKSKLITNIKELAKKCQLKADLLIEDIFKDTESISITKDILSWAKTRVEIGNPPGKAGSMGDALNWEAILHSDDMAFEDLNIVSIDKDFASPLDENELNPFLQKGILRKTFRERSTIPIAEVVSAEQRSRDRAIYSN
jgi:PIN domain